MIESPLFQGLKAAWTQEATRKAKIEDVLTIPVGRFGSKAEALETEIKAIGDDARLKELLLQAATCRTLGSFRE